MFIAVVFLGLLGYLGCVALFKKPISLSEVRALASKEDLEISSGNTMHCELYGPLLHCEYSHVPGEEDRLLFSIAIRKGELTAAFKDGELLRWSDGKKTYKPDDDADPCHKNAPWLWESLLGTIQNVVITMGAQTT